MSFLKKLFYIFEFSEEATLPGALRLGLVRYGLKQDIKIDLTLLDDMNDFSNILEGILIKNIKDRVHNRSLRPEVIRVHQRSLKSFYGFVIRP